MIRSSTKRTRLLPALALTCALAALTSRPSDAQSQGQSPAARGIDLFLHMPDSAAPGSLVPVQILAYGFPTATTLTPLTNAPIEAVWDPESLGPNVTSAPPPVAGTTDDKGRLTLRVPMPDGDARALTLLVGARAEGRARTRLAKVHRGALHEVALHVTDRRVVPGSAISAWVTVSHAATGDPIAGAPVEIALLEGGIARHTVVLKSDPAGTAMTRVPIPALDDPSWTFELRARSMRPSGLPHGESALTLGLRDETPGAPRMTVGWSKPSVLAGDRATFRAHVRDATDQPIAGLPITYWVGQKGTEPPKTDEAWDAIAKRAETNAQGEIEGSFDAPKTVRPGAPSHLRVVIKGKVEGQPLEAQAIVTVGAPSAEVSLLPEASSIVPGIAQRVLLRVMDARGNPVKGSFRVEGDGLAVTASTDKDGEAEITWDPPHDLGAQRSVGPCAGGVAAAVVVRPLGDELAPRRDPFQLCVPVQRDAHDEGAKIELARPTAKIGEAVSFKVLPVARGKRREAGPKRSWSVVLRSDQKRTATSAWIDDGEQGGTITIPPGAPGVWTITALSPSPNRAAIKAEASIVVTPVVAPSLKASITGGRATPGGSIDVAADLSDGLGKGVTGTVAALVIDLHGGGSTRGLDALDTRRSLCHRLGIDEPRCDRFVDGDPALDALRRGELGRAAGGALAASNDPGGTAREELRRTFAAVLKSLEGAVFEASQSPEQSRDVRRRGPRGWGFNPELMTLVTAAMNEPPTTPGGEPIALLDLMQIDPQVSFDNVARRITRLKLFRVLAEMRRFRREKNLDPDEPMLRDPNAILRRLVRAGRLTEASLLDPWGGTLTFVKATGPVMPFLSVRGHELRAPGPDGKIGTADDVKDPFERVLKSGTPYAKAVEEDRLVDAKLDMEVSEETVSSWQSLIEELTGSALGESFGAGGLGLGGVGSGGGGLGHGYGIGLGRLSTGIATGVGFWSQPVRTDDKGRARFTIPIGDAETTWRVALIAIADGGRAATTHLDVPSAVPLSVRLDTGATWVEGDLVRAKVIVRNRMKQAVNARVDLAASGACVLALDKDASRVVEVPAGSASTFTALVRAPIAGEAKLEARVRAAGAPDDHVTHTWQVLPPGELTALTNARWIDGAEGEAKLEAPADVLSRSRLVGEPRVVLERGYKTALAGALEALDPDRVSGADALADALEAGVRIERWAKPRGEAWAPIAARAAEIVQRARGKLNVHRDRKTGSKLAEERLVLWAPPSSKVPSPSCPPSGLRTDRPAILDAEAALLSGAALACWDAFVSETIDDVQRERDPVALARAVIAFAERTHRAETAAALADRLREVVALRPSGAIALAADQARDRASRAMVLAALLRAAKLGRPSPAPASRIAAWLLVQRDADGGYGSPSATLAAVRALLASDAGEGKVVRVTITSGDAKRTVEVGPSDRVIVPLPKGATSAVVASDGGEGFVARLERPVIRLWDYPPSAPGVVAIDARWPEGQIAGKTGVLRLDVRYVYSRSATIDVRVPLPPGASLAAQVEGIQQIQGTLVMRRPIHGVSPLLVEVPVRFGLAGVVTVPEARASLAFEEAVRGVAPARTITVVEPK